LTAVIIYFTNSFFDQYGPNAGTFLIPTEIFFTEVRTICDWISAAFGKVGALVATVIFNYTSNVQIFMISGYSSLLAFVFNIWFIPESTNHHLLELDEKWHMIVNGRIPEYVGPAGYS